MPSGPGVRWDGGYDEGDTISQYYDNLLGKLVVWAPDRDAAIARMLRALDEFEIAGVKTTIPAASRAARNRCLPRRHALDQVGRGRGRPCDVRVPTPPVSRCRRREDADRAARRADGAGRGRRPPLQRQGLAGGCTGGRTRRAGDARRPKLGLSAGGGGAGAAGSGTVIAPMQGTIVKVLVEVGATVETGQALLVLEAMKMENQINAETSGTVKEIRVQPADGVGTGDVLAIIE